MAFSVRAYDFEFVRFHIRRRVNVFFAPMGFPSGRVLANPVTNSHLCWRHFSLHIPTMRQAFICQTAECFTFIFSDFKIVYWNNRTDHIYSSINSGSFIQNENNKIDRNSSWGRNFWRNKIFTFHAVETCKWAPTELFAFVRLDSEAVLQRQTGEGTRSVQTELCLCIFNVGFFNSLFLVHRRSVQNRVFVLILNILLNNHQHPSMNEIHCLVFGVGIDICEIQYALPWVLVTQGADDTDVIVEIEILNTRRLPSYGWKRRCIQLRTRNVTSQLWTGEWTNDRHVSVSVWVCVCVRRTKMEKCETPDRLRMLRRPLNKLFQRISIRLPFVRIWIGRIHMFSFRSPAT